MVTPLPRCCSDEYLGLVVPRQHVDCSRDVNVYLTGMKSCVRSYRVCVYICVYVCNLCTLSFRRKYSLQDHVTSLH